MTRATSDNDQQTDATVIDLYTDGACLGNPGPGGWACILRDASTGDERELSGGEADTTNNRMELTAVIEGLRALPPHARVHLRSDSQYVLNGIREWMPGWKKRNWRKSNKKPVLNADLWQTIDQLTEQRDLHLEWVRGHAGHVENERCDELASMEALRIKEAAGGF